MKRIILASFLASLLPGLLLEAKDTKPAAAGKTPRVQLVCPLKPDPPPVIDGDNREWERVPSSIQVTERNVTWGKHNWKGDDDLSGTISLAYDQNYLYLLVEVIDDKVVVDEGKLVRSDHIELTFVSKMDEKLKGAISKDRLYVFGFSPGTPDKTGDPLVDVEACATLAFPPGLPWGGVDVESSFTEDGYILEARIPWKVFKLTATDIKPGAVFGLDVHFSDSDKSPVQETLTSLNHLTPWQGRKWENMPRLVLTGTDGKVK